MMFQFIFDGTTPSASASASPGLGPWPAILLLGFVAVIIIGVVFQKLIRALRRPDLIGLTPEKIRETWVQIEQSSNHGLMGAKLAVIEADKLVDGVMRSMVIPGETMGERLKMAEYKYPNIRKVWPAHKLRNQLVHDTTFELSVGQAKRALKDFHDALKTLNVM